MGLRRLILLSLAAAGVNAAAAPALTPAVRLLEERAGIHEACGAAVGRDGGILLAEITAPLDGTGQKVVILTLTNESSKDLTRISLPAALSGRYRALHGPAALRSGRFVVLVQLTDGYGALLLVDRSGTAQASKTFPLGDMMVTKMIATPSEELVLVGHRQLDATAIKVDLSGRQLWEKTLDLGAMDMFVDAVPREDGGVLLVANSGTYQHLFIGPSRVGIVGVDRSGVATTPRWQFGRFGSVVGDESGYFLLYDERSGDGQKLVLLCIVLWLVGAVSILKISTFKDV